jgi:hypothetical protein
VEGTPPPTPEHARVVEVDLSAEAPSQLADLAAASATLSVRLERSRDTLRAAEARERELARRRARERRLARSRTRPSPTRRATAAPSSPLSSPPSPAPEVSAPARGPDPWPGVSPAEREFTPGPWNLK